MRWLAAFAAISFAVPLQAQELDEDGFSAEIGYTAEVFSGGDKGSGPVVDNLELIVDAHAGSTKFHVYALYNNGRDFSGPRFPRGYVASNIEAGVKAVRLYEAWVDHEFADGLGSLRVGLYDLNSEFDALESSSLFMNPAHGIGTDFSQAGATGPSIFPVTSVGARLSIQPRDGLTLRAAILDGVPGNPARPKRTTVKLGKDDGALIAAEADLSIGRWRMFAGHWRYTGRFEDGLATELAGVLVLARGNKGFYLRGESIVNGQAEGPNVGAFFRAGIADRRFNEMREFLSGGLTATGPFASRPDDKAGIAFTWGSSSKRARRLQANLGEPISSNEWSAEASYAFQVSDWLTMQPDIQYVSNPAFERNRSSWLFGLRFEARLGL